LKKFDEHIKAMTLSSNDRLKVQVRFGHVLFKKDMSGFQTVKELRKVIGTKAAPTSFETNVRLEHASLFDVEPEKSIIFVVSIAHEGKPYVMTILQSTKDVPDGIVLGNGLVLLEVSVREEVQFRIDTLNAGRNLGIRIQMQSHTVATGGDVFKQLVESGRKFFVDPSGFINVDSLPEGFDKFHIRRKDRSRFSCGDSIWDVSKVAFWNRGDSPSAKKEERFEMELSSATFRSYGEARGERDVKLAALVDWGSLLQEAWAIAETCVKEQ
jgi:hypothetical protein